MLKSIGNRILGRILGLGILAVIIFVIIPLISAIFDIVSKIPSWILISSCCLGGTLVFGVLYVIGNQTTQNQEKQKELIDGTDERNSEDLEIFGSNEKVYGEVELIEIQKGKPDPTGKTATHKKSRSAQEVVGIKVCPNCKMKVLPKSDGTCPSCQSEIVSH